MGGAAMPTAETRYATPLGPTNRSPVTILQGTVRENGACRFIGRDETELERTRTMDFSFIVDLSNPVSFFNAFAFVCCLLSMLSGLKIKSLFDDGRWPSSIIMMVVVLIVIGFISHYAYDYMIELVMDH